MADNSLTPKEEFLLNPVTEHNITDAAIASFKTNLRHPVKVEVPLAPIQDLHGMGSPYPAGTSVNLIPDTTNTENGYVAGYYLKDDGSTVAYANSYISEYIELNSATTYTWSNRVNTNIASSICFYDENKNYISGIAINKQYSHTFTPPEGAVYCRSTQTTYAWQDALSTHSAYQLEIGSTATPYHRYSNICPIGGWTDLSATLLNKNWINAIAANLVPAASSKWKLNSEHGATLETNIKGEFGFIFRCIGNQIYHVGLDTPQKTLYYRVAEYSKKPTSYNDASRISILYESGSSTNSDLRVTITTSKNAKYVFVGIYRSYGSERKVLTNFFASLESNTFTPYNGQTIPITFTNPTTGDPMTIYGGMVSFNEDGSADVISTHCVYDIPSTQWTYSPNANVWYITRASLNPKWDISGSNQDNVRRDIVCSAYKIETYNNAVYTSYGPCIAERRYNANWIAVQTGSANVRPVDCQVKMKLATPQTYHFPNIGQLKAFLGTNNVWSDVGNINVKYLTQNSETGMEYRGDRALELRRRAMLADAPTIHTTVGSSETNGLASFKSYVKAPVKSVTIPFIPKQDLHDMDSPYPAGASVNLIPDTTDTSNGYVAGYYLNSDGTTTSNIYYYISEYIPLDTGTTYTWSNRVNTSINPSICFYDGNKDYISGIAINSQHSQTFTPPEGAVYARSSQTTYAHQETSSTNPAYQLEVGTTATEYKRYSNICPIDGYDRATLCDEQKNSFFPGLIRFNQLAITDVSKYTRVSTTLSFEDGVFTISPSTTGNTYKHARRNVVIPGHVYFVSAEGKCNSSSHASMISFGENSRDYGYVTNILYFTANSFIKKQAIRQAGVYQTTYAFRFGGSTSPSVAFEVKNFILMDLTDMFGKDYANSLLDMETAEAGAGLAIVNALFPNEYYEYNAGEITTVSEVSGFSANIIPITFTNPSTGDPMTVYGGTVTLNEDGSADLNITYHSGRIRSASWTYESSYPRFKSNVLQAPGTASTNVYCEILKGSFGVLQPSSEPYTFCLYSDKRIYMSVPDVSSVSELLEKYGDITFYYPYATPTTYHFSDIGQLKTFLGENNFWCDISDDITVKYWNRGFGN